MHGRDAASDVDFIPDIPVFSTCLKGVNDLAANAFDVAMVLYLCQTQPKMKRKTSICI